MHPKHKDQSLGHSAVAQPLTVTLTATRTTHPCENTKYRDHGLFLTHALLAELASRSRKAQILTQVCDVRHILCD